jgi:hypothetical protein
MLVFAGSVGLVLDLLGLARGQSAFVQIVPFALVLAGIWLDGALSPSKLARRSTGGLFVFASLASAGFAIFLTYSAVGDELAWPVTIFPSEEVLPAHPDVAAAWTIALLFLGAGLWLRLSPPSDQGGPA